MQKYKVQRKDFSIKKEVSFFDRLFGTKDKKSGNSNNIYPDNWTEMAETVDFCLIDVRESTSEYAEIIREFKNKLNSNIIAYIIKVKHQLIKLKCLFY